MQITKCHFPYKRHFHFGNSPSTSQLIMFAKIVVLFFLVACASAYYLASPYAAYPAYTSAVYSPYAGVYTGAYASAGYYPAYYGWGSTHKGAPTPAQATGGLTNNQ